MAFAEMGSSPKGMTYSIKVMGGMERITILDSRGVTVCGRRNSQGGIEQDPEAAIKEFVPDKMRDGEFVYQLRFYQGDGDWDFYELKSKKPLTIAEHTAICAGGDALSPAQHLDRYPIDGVTYCKTGEIRDPFSV